MLAFVSVAGAQSDAPQATRRVTKTSSTTPAEKKLSTKEQMWCPVLKSALSTAAGADPPVRSYLLDAVAGGLSKCAPRRVRNALVDSFTATLSISESQDELYQKARGFALEGKRPDDATVESIVNVLRNVEMKRTLQESALRHLLTVDEAKVEALLPQAEPDVRAALLSEMISRATSAKKFDRALALLNRVPPTEIFPYGEATQLMLALPAERDTDKQEIFRIAMAADHEQHSLAIGGDDFASMIVCFWQHVQPALVLDAIHQVLDEAPSVKEALTLNGSSGNVGFSSERDYRVFELMPILKQLDNDEADKLLQSSLQAEFQLKQFPNGIQSLDPAIDDTVSKEGETVHFGGSIGGSVEDSEGTDRTLQVVNARLQEIGRMAEENPRQAIAGVATLPQSVGPGWWLEFPRAQAYVAIARTVMKKNPSAAKDALEKMTESLKHAARSYSAIDQWLDGIGIAHDMDEVDLALKLFRAGMNQADILRNDDADLDDPNIALKAWWPSVSAYWRLVLAASQLSPQTALERVREIKDPDILQLLEVRLACQSLGAHADQITTVVHKKVSHRNWSASRPVKE